MGFVNINAILAEGYCTVSFCGHLGVLQLRLFVTAEPLTLNTEHKCDNHVQAAVRLALQNGRAELHLFQKQLSLATVLAITR